MIGADAAAFARSDFAVARHKAAQQLSIFKIDFIVMIGAEVTELVADGSVFFRSRLVGLSHRLGRNWGLGTGDWKIFIP